MIEELLDQAAEDIGIDQRGDLVAELEFVEDLLNVGGEAVEIYHEVHLELPRLSAGAQVTRDI